jgi:hypothetical protein
MSHAYTLPLLVLLALDGYSRGAVALETPGCTGRTAAQCVALSQAAMGGSERLSAIHNLRLDVISHTTVVEQSYRQAPFYSSYERDQTTIDLSGQRVRTQSHNVWPESDPREAEFDQTLIATPAGGIYRASEGDTPCGLSDLDAARVVLALGPLRVLATALAASDLHYEAAETVRGSAHTVIGFTWNQQPVRILLNAFNHLPDAVESTLQPRDFWYYWGDVRQRVYWDNLKYVQGISYPSSEITERNGEIWQSAQALDVQFNVPLDEKDFAADAAVVAKSALSKGWEREFSAAKDTKLAEGIDLFSGSWNSTIVRQEDGVVILETPISSTFTRGIFAEATKRYAGAQIKAVLSTSDSWPHVGGIRFDVAQRVPLYVLDLNEPLLDRILAAPHRINPDDLQRSPHRPEWHLVSGKTVVGSGANRMELYPLRGPSTERQYMVYFPEHKLLYASDTLVLKENHTLYDPELMQEVRLAVEREHLIVDTVYAMHEAPMSWKDVVTLLDAKG